MDTPMTLDDALQLTRAAEWRRRADGACALQPYAGDAAASARLIELLDDADTAVVQEAAEVLVRAGGDTGLSTVLRALADGDDSVGYAIRDRLIELDLAGEPVAAGSRRLLESAEEPVRRGAAEFLEVVG